MKKRVAFLGLLLISLFLLNTSALAVTKKPAITQTLVKVKVANYTKTVVVVNGYKVSGKILVPAKQTVELLGGKYVTVKGNTATISYYGASKKLVIASTINKLAYSDANVVKALLGIKYDAKTLTLTREVGNVVAEQVIPAWTSGKHNYKNMSEYIKTYKAPESDTCVNCHNGNGFGANKTKAADVDLTADPSIGCANCHYSERGSNLIKTGNSGVVAAGFELNNIGPSAICVNCHNSRAAANATTFAAPHPGSESDIVYAKGGYQFDGTTLPGVGHNASKISCVFCHMAPDQTGVKNHSLKVNVANSCALCHKGATTVNIKTFGDYDGNKKIEGIQDEVAGLLAEVDQAFKDQGVEATTVPGKIVLKKDGQEITDAKLYYAAWNYNLVKQEGTKGIHNPKYVVMLLQSTYKNLTGNDVPNATIKK